MTCEWSVLRAPSPRYFIFCLGAELRVEGTRAICHRLATRRASSGRLRAAQVHQNSVGNYSCSRQFKPKNGVLNQNTVGLARVPIYTRRTESKCRRLS